MFGERLTVRKRKKDNFLEHPFAEKAGAERKGREEEGKEPAFLKTPVREHLRHLPFLDSVSPRIPVN